MNSGNSLGRISVCLAAVLCTSSADRLRRELLIEIEDCGETGRNHKHENHFPLSASECLCYDNDQILPCCSSGVVV